ncbi:MAG: DNA-binding response regulator [Betaproteobacteria bacterium]|nr:MAG: DNA-binding response regulator [Betaproteobacteria bacterium]TAG43791.1 MAG: DNA-binding response regulator [Betaproteobacteria bacterium]
MISVAIIDDHPIVRAGLRGILSTDKELVVVAEGGDSAGAVDIARSGRADVMLLDLSLPGRGGFTLLQRLLDEAPSMRIIVLSMYDPETHKERAVSLGASEYLPKGSSAETIISCIKRAATLPQPRRGKRSDGEPHTQLSNRQYDVLVKLVSGRSVTDIATELNLSVKTVSSHKIAVQRRLDAASVVDLVNYANVHALVPRLEAE